MASDRPPLVPEAGSHGPAADWAQARDLLRARGLRWTAQRRVLVEVLSRSRGHLTGGELVERCRAVDPATTPSTVYRTLDVLEELGLVRHCHGADGREEFHVLPEREHGHLYCATCGASWDIGTTEAAGFVRGLRRDRGFEVDLSHVTIVGRCAGCRARDDQPAG
ncbi:MAG TPA: Fur family transcriptional regulator [Candidatus Limnocylindrales bacterium]